MLLDTSRFDFTKSVERRFEVIRREMLDLAVDEFTRWPVANAFDGDWLVFTFKVHCPPPGMEFDLAGNRARCPRTAEFLDSLDGLLGAAFSRIGPGSRIHRHADLPVPGMVRTHLGLRIPQGAYFQVADARYSWNEGRLLAFDGSIEHYVENLSGTPRDVLIMDFAVAAEAGPRGDVAREHSEPRVSGREDGGSSRGMPAR